MPPPLPTRPQARDLHCLSFIASCNNQPSVTYCQHSTVYSTMKSVFITEGLKSLNAEFQAASPEASDAEKVGNSARRQSKGRKRILGHFSPVIDLRRENIHFTNFHPKQGSCKCDVRWDLFHSYSCKDHQN